ncbi:uncharacterized protein HLK63_K09031 [Nakaseomyces glabratus]|nr:uncharacterized protein GW608_K09031 [Nakaseomyces glabratus]UCS27659.1 uncharacterized protein HLK63_K09031 [Nakaseomyces glabratus]UCS32888.1 uncharacterized protein HLK64_K09031 [Nakaseomyces glabratus]UCS38117.1 uncharacterized protein HLK62_K09031 [Nakaseomyces glabratus]
MDELVVEELESLEAIYPDLLKRDDAENIFAMKVPQHEKFTVKISLPDKYPATEPPHVLEVSVAQGNYDSKYLKTLFQEVMDSMFHQGSVCLFDFLTELDGVLYDDEEESSMDAAEVVDNSALVSVDPFEGWTASDPISDRGSTFMAFAAHVNSEEEAFQMLDHLKTDSKMRRANHAMCAWRIKKQTDSNDIIYQDCDDDGETAAGSRMLHLVTIMDVWNVIVVVARWFGGVHIGPDRFKHINSTAREAILRAGFTPAKK